MIQDSGNNMVRHSNLAIKKRHQLTMSYLLPIGTVGSHDAFGMTIVVLSLYTQSFR